MAIQIPESRDPRRLPLEGPILVAHQPQFLPWLGFFNKAAMGDAYLIFDVDQFKKETFENRNKIRIHNEPGWMWLSAPVIGKSEILNMKDVRFNGFDWRKKAVKTIELSYRRSAYFEKYFELIREILLFPGDSLGEFNINAIRHFFDILNINVPVYRASEVIAKGYELKGESTDAVISMCEWFDAKAFVAGVMGKAYLERDKFKASSIQLAFQKFEHPVYKQLHGDFMTYMSIIDLLFNHGPEAKNILGESNYEL